MKKKLLFVIVIIVFSIAFACTRENNHVPMADQTTQLAFDELNGQLAQLDLKYADSVPLETRGRFWNFLKAVFAGDLAGALAGAECGSYGTALAGGILCSLITLIGLTFSGGAYC